MKIDEKKAELLKQLYKDSEEFYKNSEEVHKYYMEKAQDEYQMLHYYIRKTQDKYQKLIEKLKQQLDNDLNLAYASCFVCPCCDRLTREN